MIDSLRLFDLGIWPYMQTWKLQRLLNLQLQQGKSGPALILCEHPSVITLGRRANRDNILATETELNAMGVEIIESDRGGEVTWHGPGQLVCYVIIDLTKHRRDVGWFMRSMEEVIIRTLQQYEITGFRIPGRTGVWTENREHGIPEAPRKIASLGVRISRWCTLHGFSINFQNCQEGFGLIRPCGMQGVKVTSIQEESLEPAYPALLKQRVLSHFLSVFEYFGVEECPAQAQQI
ncbi:MAG: lipoyl(octanoyl) transferase LipB [Deltaproteobacteria bacterium]|nr:lipoyl(octanoyl) transferase LipB [Deltaproteobacteria bacterium]